MGAIATLSYFQVILGFTLHEVHAVAAGNFFYVNIHRFIRIQGGFIVVAGHFTGQVEIFVAVLLMNEELISLAGFGFYSSGTDSGNIICAGVLPVIQGAAGGKLDGALIVGQSAGNGDGITNTDLISTFALQAVAIDGLTINNHRDSYILEAIVIGGLDLGNLAGQSCLVGQGFIFGQSKSFLDNLLGIGGSFHFGAGLFNLNQCATSGVLNGAVVIGDVTLNGDGIADQEGICAFALNAVAQDGILGVAFNFHGDGYVLVAGIIGSVDLGNLTGQSCLICGRFASGQAVGILQDLLDLFGSVNSFAGDYAVQGTTCTELDLTLIVGQSAGNGNGVADLQAFSAFALQAVTLNGLAINADNIDGYGDVLVAIVIGGRDTADHTGQGDLVVHGSALLQSIGFINNSTEVQVHLGNDVLPAEGNDLVAILDGGGQGVGNFFCGGFVYIDGHAAISVLDHLDVLFSYVNRPYNFVGLAVHRNSANAGKVPRGLLCGLSVEGLDIFQRCLNISRRTGRTAGFLLHAGGQAGAKAQAECQNQDKCE